MNVLNGRVAVSCIELDFTSQMFIKKKGWPYHTLKYAFDCHVYCSGAVILF